MSAYKLMTVDGQPKTIKGEKAGYLTAVLHFAPHTLSGYNVCAWADGCQVPCLHRAGRGGMRQTREDGAFNSIEAARIRKARLFFESRERFMVELAQDLARLVREASKRGLQPAARLNGTADILWERVPFASYPNIMAAFPEVTFYDYTKAPMALRTMLPANYSLTFSRGASMPDTTARAILASGRNLAVVFDARKGQALPAEWNGFAVVDADTTDLRFLDPRGVVCGLRAKGPARKDASGFVVAA